MMMKWMEMNMIRSIHFNKENTFLTLFKKCIEEKIMIMKKKILIQVTWKQVMMKFKKRSEEQQGLQRKKMLNNLD